MATSRSTPFADLLGLRVVGDAPEHGDDGAPAVAAERLADLLDLPAELAGGGDDEGGGVGGAAVGDGRACHALQNGQDESGRLAGTGLRRAHHVVPCEDARDGLFLDGSRRVVAHGGHAGEQLAGEAELGEPGQIDQGRGADGARGVLALLVALVDALAAAAVAVAARAAASVAVAAGAVAAGAGPAEAAVALVLALSRLALRLLVCALLGGGLGHGRRGAGRSRLRLPAALRGGAGTAAVAAALATALLAVAARRPLGTRHGGIADWVQGLSLPRRLLTRQHVAIRGRA